MTLPTELESPRVRDHADVPECAVVLVGGQGTRLRPLTDDVPKPMLPLLGKPLLEYTFDQLREVGVRRVVLACGYLPRQIETYFGREADGLEIEYRVEPEPLGTGGAARFAASDIDESFFLLNGDSLREVDLRQLLELHRARRAKATLLLTRVPDPSRFGLVRLDGDGRVRGFLEKPRADEIDTDLINAGLYVLEPEVVENIPAGRPVSIEREVFPELAAEGALFGCPSDGYWIDVGTVASYLQAHLDLLARRDGATVDPGARVAETATVGHAVFVDRGATIAPNAELVESVYVAPGARVGSGARLARAVVLPDANVADGAVVEDAIVASGLGVITA